MGGQAGPGWPGKVPGPQNGGRKTWFCGGMVSKMEIRGFPLTQMDCMLPRRLLGVPISPQTPPENGFPRISPISGKLGRVPLAPCVSPIGPLRVWRSCPLILWTRAYCRSGFAWPGWHDYHDWLGLVCLVWLTAKAQFGFKAPRIPTKGQ